jgi:hypothetical protein
MNIPLTVPDFKGKHNQDLNISANRLNVANSANDLSTICVIPTSGLVSAKVVEKWLIISSQMNQKLVRIPTITGDKYHCYNNSIEQILSTPGFNNFKYLFTMEENYLPPLDGLVRLFEGIREYDVVSGLIFTMGEESKAMIYGHPAQIPSTFLPVSPMVEGLQQCLGLPTGFTLYKLDIFKDPKVPKPWFRTNLPHEVNKPKTDHDDQYFFENIHKLGYKVACDTRIKVGHLDKNDLVW